MCCHLTFPVVLEIWNKEEWGVTMCVLKDYINFSEPFILPPTKGLFGSVAWNNLTLLSTPPF